MKGNEREVTGRQPDRCQKICVSAGVVF